MVKYIPDIMRGLQIAVCLWLLWLSHRRLQRAAEWVKDAKESYERSKALNEKAQALIKDHGRATGRCTDGEGSSDSVH